jgi:methylenetetrahydrofolate dehydrogenase (NADP+) / methenyltetrahydrofolate cyclohydrolase
MAAQRLDGTALAAEVRASVAVAVSRLQAQPGLAVVLVGNDPASEVYVRNKIRATEAAGIVSKHFRLPATASQNDVETQIAALNDDPAVDGILLQLPLPKGLDADRAISRIDPDKDVDGLTETSAGRLLLGRPGLLARRALGNDLSGRHVVVIGRSILVGKPAALLFLAENCTVTIAHSRSAELRKICQQADILVPAVGRPEMVRGDWVKPGATIIDVGINRVDDPGKGAGKTRLVGDAHFAECAEVAAYITPVPGGVGPMTIACLLTNTVLAAAARRDWPRPRGLPGG